MARNVHQYTFTFTNAQPGASVHFGPQGVKVYSSATDLVEDGPILVLDSANTVTVWSDATTLIAYTVDGRGEQLSATASPLNPTVTTDTGTAGTSPFGSGSGTSSTYTSVTANHTAVDHEVVFGDASGGGFNVTAPASGVFVVRNKGASGNMTVLPHAAESIDGGATKTVGPGQSFALAFDGTNWWTI